MAECRTPAYSLGELPRSRSGESLVRLDDPVGRGEWRIRERVKTVSAGLLLCLHLGVDPPDVHKTSPAARLECWTDPEEAKARETIIRNLQQQYEYWQPRVRYKPLFDPTVDEVKKLCQALRKGAKEERVLLHYNGHGVPKPTRGGELWCFNKQFTQYIPVAVADLHSWIASPALLVFDCSAAGNLFHTYRRIAEAGEDLLFLAACGAHEVLPMAPEMPADIFTACLTAPMEIAIRWHLYRASPLMPPVTPAAAMTIPGRLNDRRTPLGELNWILTAITDTIAWTALPRDVFKKLFRQDVMVASLFRNFLLAVRILKSFHCNPVCWPSIPTNAVVSHEMWQAWDHSLDYCLSQTMGAYEPTAFFTGQMDAFALWISQKSLGKCPPSTSAHLAIVLQVLLSQTHRNRALQLLGSFADLGDWALLDCLHVGVFPYVLKLFQSPSTEIQYSLLYLWLRILRFDPGCAGDLVKDDSYLYLVKILLEPTEDSPDLCEVRSMAIVCLCLFSAISPLSIDTILAHKKLFHRLTAFVEDTLVLSEWAMHLLSILLPASPAESLEKLDETCVVVLKMLESERPENRCAAVHCLGRVLSYAFLGEELEGEIVIHLLQTVSDCHPQVRKELVIAFSGLVSKHANKFILAAYDLWMAHDGNKLQVTTTVVAPGAGDFVRNASVYTLVWKICLVLAVDPFDQIAHLASQLVDEVHMGFLFPVSKSPPRAAEEERDGDEGEGGGNDAAGHDKPQVVFVQGHEPSTLSIPEATLNRPASAEQGRERRKSPLHMYGPKKFDAEGTLVLESSFPLSSTIVAQAAKAFAENQRRNREVQRHCQGDLTRAKINKLQVVDAEEGRLWMAMTPVNRRFDYQLAILDVGSPLTATLFHPLADRVITADERANVCVWDWTADASKSAGMITSSRTNLFRNGNDSKTTRITGLACVDWDPVKLLVSSSDGVIRLYEAFEDGPEFLKSAWTVGALPARNEDQSVALLLEWNQHQRRLYTVAGGVDFAVLDACREKIVQRISMPDGALASTITSDKKDAPIVTLGFADGWIRRYDLRLAESSQMVAALKGHESWVVGVRHPQDGHELFSASMSGEVVRWDLRRLQPVLKIDAYRSTGQVCMEAHGETPLIACAGADQSAKFFDAETATLTTHVKYHDGFLGQRIGPIACLAFHPRRLCVSIGSTDGLLSLYAARL